MDDLLFKYVSCKDVINIIIEYTRFKTLDSSTALEVTKNLEDFYKFPRRQIGYYCNCNQFKNGSKEELIYHLSKNSQQCDNSILINNKEKNRNNEQKSENIKYYIEKSTFLKSIESFPNNIKELYYYQDDYFQNWHSYFHTIQLIGLLNNGYYFRYYFNKDDVNGTGYREELEMFFTTQFDEIFESIDQGDNCKLNGLNFRFSVFQNNQDIKDRNHVYEYSDNVIVNLNK